MFHAEWLGQEQRNPQRSHAELSGQEQRNPQSSHADRSGQKQVNDWSGPEQPFEYTGKCEDTSKSPRRTTQPVGMYHAIGMYLDATKRQSPSH